MTVPRAASRPAASRTAASRTRDAEATRRALLDAARSLFSSEGYDATTVRAVADRAGVNQALLFRYFGNKEGLYVEAVGGRALDLLTDGPADELLERILTAVLRPADPGDTFIAVLRGVGSQQVGTQLRAEVGGAYREAVADLVDTTDRTDARTRADLLLAWLLGISVVASLPDQQQRPLDATLPHLLRAARALLQG
jgi:AcrR family transcriptional regulator